MDKKVIFICFLTLILKSCFQDSKKELPIYNPSDFDSKLVDKSLRSVKKTILLENLAQLIKMELLLLQRIMKTRSM